MKAKGRAANGGKSTSTGILSTHYTVNGNGKKKKTGKRTNKTVIELSLARESKKRGWLQDHETMV